MKRENVNPISGKDNMQSVDALADFLYTREKDENAPLLS
jgi:hypothetical protein